MNHELEKIPGVIWSFSQPIADNMEEAVSGVKGQLATKVYGDDLHVLEDKADADRRRSCAAFAASRTSESFACSASRTIISWSTASAAARYQINVADVQDAIQTAVGGNALTQVLAGRGALRPGDALSAAIPRHAGGHREHPPAGAHRRARLAGAALQNRRARRRRSEIYREGNERYVAIKYSVRGRDLGGAVEEAIDKVKQQVASCRAAITSTGRANTKARSAPRPGC